MSEGARYASVMGRDYWNVRDDEDHPILGKSDGLLRWS